MPLVIAIVFHEISHGLVARRLGDPTAAERGRLSRNPIKHVDPFGTIVLPLLLAISHAPIFGWAKPVPVNYRKLKHPRRDMILVALAGPGMNFLLAFIGSAILAVTLAMSGPRFLVDGAIVFVMTNIFLAIFNLLPIPPFDGGHVVEGLLPRSAARHYRKIGRFSLLVFVMLLLVLPAMSPSADVIGKVVSPIVRQLTTGLLSLFGLQT